MKIPSIKPRITCVTLSASFGSLDSLPKWIRDKLVALGIVVPKNITEAEALILIEQKEKEIKEKEKIEKLQKTNLENNDSEEQKLLDSLALLSQNNRVILKLKKSWFKKIN